MSAFPKFQVKSATAAKVANPAKVEGERPNFSNFSDFSNAPLPDQKEPLPAPPATEPPPRNQQEDPSLMAECRTCLRYDPRGHYCGHKLRVIREGEVLICAGKGYSPKGSPWKECQS